jgi:chemotaxis protein CheD
MVASRSTLAVGLGEMKISRDPQETLVAYGLGSCVGVGVYDPQARVAGLLHAILPERPAGADPLSPKYVDSGITGLLAALEAGGAERRRMVVRMAGGANMLTAPGFKQSLNIGERNVAAALAALSAHKLPVKSQEVGGHVGRTVRLYVADGRMTLRAIGNPEREF